MASEILRLFTSPEDYQMRQQQAQQDRALQFAQLNPFEKASYGIYQGAGQLAGAGAQLFGLQDPQLQKISMRQQILTGGGGMPPVNLNDPQSMIRAAKDMFRFDPEFAQGLIVAANELNKNIADIQAKTATAAKTQSEIDRENQYRQAIAALPPDATEADRLAVVSKFASADKSLTLLERAEEKKALRTAREQELADRAEQRRQELVDKAAERSRELELTHQRRLEELERRGADAKELQKQRAADKRESDAQRAADKRAADAQRLADKREAKALIEASKPPKTLSAALQKEETGNLENIDKYDAQLKALDAPIKNLTPDPKTKKPALDLGLGKNFWNSLVNRYGSSTPESRAYEELKSAVDTAVNLQVSAEKGVQTNADVIRFREALIAASGGNDTETTRQALIRFRDAIKADKESKIKLIESRRKSQGVEPYFSSGGSRVIDFNDIGR